MIYLEFDENNKEKFIHFNPFDENFGLHKTEEELLKTGILVESLPQHTNDTFGKDFFIYNNPLRWVYVERPLTRYERLTVLLNQGRITQEEMNELL